jgi:hypothetical protein
MHYLVSPPEIEPHYVEERRRLRLDDTPDEAATLMVAAGASGIGLNPLVGGLPSKTPIAT